MNSKKMMFGLAMAAMVAGLAACGGGNGGNSSTPAAGTSAPAGTSAAAGTSVETTTVKINVWSQQNEHAVINKVVEDYNKGNSSIKIEVNNVAVGEDSAGSTFATDPKPNNYPSLLAIADDQLANLVKKGYVTAVPDTVATAIKADDNDLSVIGSTVGDKLYGYPVQADNGYFLYYDGDQITDEQAKSIESIINVCQQKNKSFYYDIGNGYYSAAMFLASNVGGKDSIKWHTNDAGKNVYDISWDNAASVTAAEYLSGLFATNYTNKVMVSGNDAVITGGFQDGSMIAGITGTWNYDALSSSIRNLKATKLPTFTDSNGAHQMGAFVGSKLYVVNSKASANEQRAAMALARALTTKDAQLLRYETRGAVPCNKAALEDARYTEHSTVATKAISAQAEFSAIQAQAVEGRYWDVGKAIGLSIQTGKLGDFTWAEYLKGQCDLLRAAAA